MSEHHRLAVVAQDAVHLRGIEEVGEEDIGDRHQDEPDDDLADEPVGAQAERGGHDLACERRGLLGEDERLVGETLRAVASPFLAHLLKKLLRIGCKFNFNCVILQPEIGNG